MKPLSDLQRGALMSSMSDASVGMTLGRSKAWVVRQRADIRAAEAATVQSRTAVASVPWSPGVDPFEEAKATSMAVLPRREAVRATQPAEKAARRVRKSSKPSAPKRSGEHVQADGRHRKAAKLRALHAASVPVSSRLKPVSARISRWAGHFLAAAWDLDEVAYLFGVGPEDLAASLSRGA